MLLHLPLIERIIETANAGQRSALCAVVRTRGSTPQRAGAMMLVDEKMNTLGTLGGGCVEAEIRKRAFELLNRGEAKLLEFQLDHDYGWDDGLICGGHMAVAVMPILSGPPADPFREALSAIAQGEETRVPLRVEQEGMLQEYRVLVEAEPRLIIAGAGHIGVQLARLGVELEFDVTVIDDRADCANTKRLPPPIRIVVGDIEKNLREMNPTRDTYVVIVTRGHNHDEQALAAVVATSAKYIGMIGSKRKIKLIFDDLTEAGVDPANLARVRAPVGLPIRAVTVPEIAVSIAAQLIEVRRASQTELVEGPVTIAKEHIGKEHK